jgi:hypothetical protein
MKVDGFKVQASQCATCIYRKDSALDIADLERQIADPHMAGYFRGYRTCHHAPDRSGICCRGFWNRHKDRFTLGQIAQRLRAVVFVQVDRFTKGTR